MAQGHGRGDGGHGRTWVEIRGLLEGAAIGGDVRARAVAIFERIARAEARIHGLAVDDVHFHEVGAIDSIVDVVGAAAALAWLAPARTTSRPVALGGGVVRCQHGLLPVPAPATLEILRERGAPTEHGGVDLELTTPTGAAILAASVDDFAPAPPLRPRAIGYGCGDRDLVDRPNVLRVVLGEPPGEAAAAEVILVEANLDDQSAELTGHLLEALLAAGALDAWATPIVMKKGRPAVLVGALAAPAGLDAVERAFLRESTTFGLRRTPASRRVLARRWVRVATPYGAIRVKVGDEGGPPLTAAPEHEDCRRAAEAAGVPLKEVYLAAACAFRDRGGDPV